MTLYINDSIVEAARTISGKKDLSRQALGANTLCSLFSMGISGRDRADMYVSNCICHASNTKILDSFNIY